MQNLPRIDNHHIANLPRRLTIFHTTSAYATIIIKLFSLFPGKYSDIHHAKLTENFVTTTLPICPDDSPHATRHATIIIKLLFSLFPEKYSDIHHGKLTGDLVTTTLPICPDDSPHAT